MFGSFGKKTAKKKAAIQSLVEQYRAQFGLYIKMGYLEDIIRTDGYVAGYFFSKQTNLLAHMINIGEVERSDREEISLNLMEALFGSDRARSVFKSIQHYFEIKDPRYSEGVEKAARVVTFAVGVSPYRSDPDYTKAVEAFKRKEAEHGSILAPDDHTAAIIGFEQLWLGDLLEKLVFDDSGS